MVLALLALLELKKIGLNVSNVNRDFTVTVLVLYKTALTNFKGMKSDNFVFICNNCLTSKEHIEASSVKEQLAMLVRTVSDLKREFREFKSNTQLLPKMLLLKLSHHLLQLILINRT